MVCTVGRSKDNLRWAGGGRGALEDLSSLSYLGLLPQNLPLPPVNVRVVPFSKTRTITKNHLKNSCLPVSPDSRVLFSWEQIFSVF